MTKDKLQIVLEKHKKWLNDEDGRERADLSRTDLREADLCEANLSRADLREADLREANLSRADLREADLREANLRGADLRWADLHGTDLSRADLSGANLRGADLSGANLRGTKIDIDILNNLLPICCPEHGSFTAWKKAYCGYIVKLEVTESAKRSSAYGRKCRCSEARVLAIENIDGTAADVREVRSQHDSRFMYRVGETVSVDDFDEDRRKECASGIHFFITRQEAVNY